MEFHQSQGPEPGDHRELEKALDNQTNHLQHSHSRALRRRKPGIRATHYMTFCMLLLALMPSTTSGQAVTQQCKDIGILPTELTVTEARDADGNLTDIHTFNRFFTYQVPHDARPTANVVATRFAPSMAHWRVHDK